MMTGAGRRGIPILDGAETAVAAARVAVRSASRSAFRRGLAQTFTPPHFSLCSSTLAPSGSFRQVRSPPIASLLQIADWINRKEKETTCVESF